MRESISYRASPQDVLGYLNGIDSGQLATYSYYLMPEVERFCRHAELTTSTAGGSILTDKGRLFIRDPKTRSIVFRSILFQIRQFADIWSEIEKLTSAKGNTVAKQDIKECVLKTMNPLTSNLKSSTPDVYTNRVIAWASFAELLTNLETDGRIEEYHIHKRDTLDTEPELEQEPAKQALKTVPTEMPPLEATTSHVANYADEIAHIVCALTRHPRDRQLLNEVRVLANQWREVPEHSRHKQREKRMILHLIDHALKTGRHDEFEMVAEAVWILRREYREASV